MNKNHNSLFLFQCFIRFSLVAFITCVAGIFFQENANAQNFNDADGSIWQNSNQTLLVGNNSYTGGSLIQYSSLILSKNGTLGAGDFSIGRNATLDLGGSAQKISAIELADGSKVVNGTIILDSTLPSGPSFLPDILALFNVQKDESGNYDLGAITLTLPAITFTNGGQIIDGRLEIQNDLALIMIKEVISISSNLIVGCPQRGYDSGKLSDDNNTNPVTEPDSVLVNSSTLN